MGASKPFKNMPGFDSFRRNAQLQHDVEDISSEAKDIIKQRYRSPEQLIQYIESHGTPVVILSDLRGKLACLLLGVDPGFVPPPTSHEKGAAKRFNWLMKYIAWETGRELNPMETGLFVLPRSLFTMGCLAHQFHHWLAFKSGLPGYCTDAKEAYRKLWGQTNEMLERDLDNMSVEEIKTLRAAVNRDMEAMQFLWEIINEVFVPANQAEDLLVKGSEG